MSWRKVRLGDIAEFSNGLNFGKEAYSKGIKLIGVSDFGNRFFPEYNELEEVKEQVVRQNDLLTDGDIVFVRSNGNKELVGRCMLIQNPPTKVTFSGFCIKAKLTDLENHDPMFWAYHFKNQGFRRAMSGTAIGANIQNLSQGRLAVYEAEVPDLESQRRIASLLSKYDRLISNNQKQIKLLEEAAQRLYKEWFIDLRFPGYEDCKIVDRVPEGWHKAKVTDFLEVKYGKDHKALADGNIPVYGSGGVMRYVKPILYSGESVLIPRKGSLNNILLVSGDFWTIDTMFFSIPKLENVAKYTYLFLKGLDMYSFNIGAAVPSMTVKILEEIDILHPTDTVLEQFERITSPIFEMKTILERQIKEAEQARDRLLPKLMTGELEV